MCVLLGWDVVVVVWWCFGSSGLHLLPPRCQRWNTARSGPQYTPSLSHTRSMSQACTALSSFTNTKRPNLRLTRTTPLAFTSSLCCETPPKQIQWGFLQAPQIANNKSDVVFKARFAQIGCRLMKADAHSGSNERGALQKEALIGPRGGRENKEERERTDGLYGQETRTRGEPWWLRVIEPSCARSHANDEWRKTQALITSSKAFGGLFWRTSNKKVHKGIKGFFFESCSIILFLYFFLI